MKTILQFKNFALLFLMCLVLGFCIGCSSNTVNDETTVLTEVITTVENSTASEDSNITEDETSNESTIIDDSNSNDEVVSNENPESDETTNSEPENDNSNDVSVEDNTNENPSEDSSTEKPPYDIPAEEKPSADNPPTDAIEPGPTYPTIKLEVATTYYGYTGYFTLNQSMSEKDILLESLNIGDNSKVAVCATEYTDVETGKRVRFAFDANPGDAKNLMYNYVYPAGAGSVLVNVIY